MNRVIQLKQMKNSYLKSSDYKYICNKILKSYFINVILLRKKEFKIIFKAKHIQPLKKRVLDYFKYYCDLIYIKFFFHSIYYTKSMKKSFYPYKPVHLKHIGNTNELLLEHILNNIDLTIKAELLGLLDTEYIIGFKALQK